MQSNDVKMHLFDMHLILYTYLFLSYFRFHQNILPINFTACPVMYILITIKYTHRV